MFKSIYLSMNQSRASFGVSATQAGNEVTVAAIELDIDAAAARTPAATSLVERMSAEYREMPGMCLTLAQAARLWTVDAATCAAVFDALVARGELRRGGDGRYRAVADDLRRRWRGAR
jgi:hypothetical protein